MGSASLLTIFSPSRRAQGSFDWCTMSSSILAKAMRRKVSFLLDAVLESTTGVEGTGEADEVGAGN